MNEDVKKQVARALGAIPSGCFVLTASDGGRASGILASWVQQASFNPPMVVAAVKHGRPVQEIIEASGHFVLNHIGENPLAMFRHFGRGFRPDEPAFDGLSTQADRAGVVIQDCPGHLSCKIVGQIDTGDHRLYTAEVIGGFMSENVRPYVHLRSNGLQY